MARGIGESSRETRTHRWRADSGNDNNEAMPDRLQLGHGEADEEEDPRHQGGEDHAGIGRNEDVRVRSRLLQATERLDGQGGRDEREEGPGREAGEEDVQAVKPQTDG